jgi:hypothetical protein
VSLFVTSTWAPPTADPEGSITVPLIDPVVVWADKLVISNRDIANRPATFLLNNIVNSRQETFDTERTVTLSAPETSIAIDISGNLIRVKTFL